MTPERLGELCRLAIAHCSGGFPNRRPLPEEVGSALHPNSAEVAAEVAVASFREGALQLSARNEESARYLLESQLIGVFARYYGSGLLEEFPAPSLCVGSDCHRA